MANFPVPLSKCDLAVEPINGNRFSVKFFSGEKVFAEAEVDYEDFGIFVHRRLRIPTKVNARSD